METIDVARSLYKARQYLNIVDVSNQEDIEAEIILNMARNKIDVLLYRLASLSAALDHFTELVQMIYNEPERYILRINTTEDSDNEQK